MAARNSGTTCGATEDRATFTPGPWMVDPARADTVVQALGPPLARAYAPRFCGSRDGKRSSEAAANARLMAASLDLLTAAQIALAFIMDEYTDPRAAALEGDPIEASARPARDALCAAIAKAAPQTTPQTERASSREDPK